MMHWDIETGLCEIATDAVSEPVEALAAYGTGTTLEFAEVLNLSREETARVLEAHPSPIASDVLWSVEKRLNRRAFVGGMQTVTVLPGTFLPLYGHDPQPLTRPNAWMGAARVQWWAGANLFVRLFANHGRAFGDNNVFENAAGSIDDVLTGLGLDLIHRTPIGPLMLLLGTDRPDRFPDAGLRVGYMF